MNVHERIEVDYNNNNAPFENLTFRSSEYKSSTWVRVLLTLAIQNSYATKFNCNSAAILPHIRLQLVRI